MNTRRVFTQIILFLSIGVLWAGAAYAQQAPRQPEAGSTLWQSKLIVKGKIGNNKSFGGYYAMGEDPARAFFIVNQNRKVLKKLFKSAKKITIEGYLKEGADNLFIEKIDGRPYSGDTAANDPGTGGPAKPSCCAAG
jgi:hypothetical protein